jgi:hypothetical protein
MICFAVLAYRQTMAVPACDVMDLLSLGTLEPEHKRFRLYYQIIVVFF